MAEDVAAADWRGVHGLKAQQQVRALALPGLLTVHNDAANPNLNPNPNPNPNQVYSPYNDTEDENLVNKFADGEPGGAGVTKWWKSFTIFVPIPACLDSLTVLKYLLQASRLSRRWQRCSTPPGTR